MKISISAWPELLVVYGPFFVSLLMLIPKGDWILNLKFREILPKEQVALEEVLLTADLCGRLEKLIDLAGFEILLAYLVFLSGLLESNRPSQREVFISLVIMIVYHLVLVVASRVIYGDIHSMAYPHLRQRHKKILGRVVTGSAYLLIFTVGLVLWTLICTVMLRLVLLERI